MWISMDLTRVNRCRIGQSRTISRMEFGFGKLGLLRTSTHQNALTSAYMCEELRILTMQM